MAPSRSKAIRRAPALALISDAVPSASSRALVEDQDPVGDGVRLLQVVRGEEDRTALVGLFAHGGPEGVPRGDVHPGGRLVEDDQVVVPGRRQREADPLLLAAGELVDHAVGDLGDTRAVEHVGDRAGVAVQIAGQLDQLADLDVLHQSAALQHRADAAVPDGLLGGGAEDPDGARVGVAQPEQEVERRRLARPVGAEERDGLAGVQIEVRPATACTWP